jgi:tripartite-type tricarboxylate transporter receptor subunit TctC
MKLQRRRFLQLAAGAAALPAVSRFAWAQSYPTKPVRIIVGFTPGGTIDILARLIGRWLSERLGQPFIIENRPGAASNLGTEAVVRAPADGYTLLLFNSAAAINATLYDKLSFNFIRDIAPVAGISRESSVVVVNPSVPTKTFPEFIAYANANPGKLSMGSAGNGSAAHMAGELFKTMTGINLVHVPYRGSAPALTDLLSGQVQVMFASIPSTIEYTRAGNLRPLAVTTAMRSEALADIPSVGEFVPGYEASVWWGAGVLRPPASSTSSPRRSMRASSTPKSRRGSPNSAALCLRARPTSSASSSSRRSRSGARWSNLPVRKWTDPKNPGVMFEIAVSRIPPGP